jgi:hypothetical protein
MYIKTVSALILRKRRFMETSKKNNVFINVTFIKRIENNLSFLKYF